MTDHLKPRDAKDVEDAVSWSLANEKTLEITGQGSKRQIGRPSQSEVTLDLSALTGITLYEPEELVLSARAGTPIAEIESCLAARNQELAFEPMDYAPIFGMPIGGGTLGGVLATNLSGPRRIKAGAARDHFLGVTAVSGRGETFKSGGRVVKNVTGYDLCKLLAGSYGTLAAMTDVTVKVLPRAEMEASVILHGPDIAQAAAAMSAAMGSSGEVSGAAHVPAALAGRCPGLPANISATILRVEGVLPSVTHRREMLAALLKPYGEVLLLEEAASRALWRALRDVTPFAAAGPSGDRVLWRVSTAPSNAPAIPGMLPPDAECLYDWAGGLVWIAMTPARDGGAPVIRKLSAALGGHALLVRAPLALRAALDIFEPQEHGMAALHRRVKESFDPKGLLNPGRMWAGI